MSDDGCICRGNWQKLVKEYEPLIGKRYRDQQGKEWGFFGLVHAEDDYYFGMSSGSGIRLLSCVGSIDAFGFDEI